jgi:hypothetical protein
MLEWDGISMDMDREMADVNAKRIDDGQHQDEQNTLNAP